MTRVRIRALAAAVTLAAAAGTTSACSEPSTPRPCITDPVRPGLAIAVGGHANNPRPTMPKQVEDAVSAVVAATEAGARDRGVTLVRVDGRPTIGCVMAYASSAGNETKRKADRAAFLSAVRTRVAEMTAQQTESNPLEALSLAAAAAGPGGTVVLLDSGLQTAAPLDFRRPGLLAADIDSVTSQLAGAGALPDLKGKKLVLAGIGYTAPPQRALDENRRSHLIELWQRVATRAGAAPVLLIETPNTTPSVGGLPPVGTVHVPPADEIDLGCNTERVLDNGGPVGFRAESTTFVDETAARKLLRGYADWLVTHPEGRADLIGSVAHYGIDDPRGLSKDRADRVGALLVELGAESDQVTTRGAGWGPFPTKKASPDGGTSDARNRRVKVRMLCG